MGIASTKRCFQMDTGVQIDFLAEDLIKMKMTLTDVIDCTKTTIFDPKTGTIKDVEHKDEPEPKSKEQQKKEEGKWIIKNGKQVKIFTSDSPLTDNGEQAPPEIVTQEQVDTWEFNQKREEMLGEYKRLLNRIEMALLAIGKLRSCDINEINIGEGLEQSKSMVQNLIEECTLTINTNAISLISGHLTPVQNVAAGQ